MTLTCRIGLLVLAVIPCFLGCDEDEVAWLPDSSGVIYRNQEQGYSVYDLRTKAEREVLKSNEDGPSIEGVAVSPKGDQFALAEITFGEEPQIEIVLHPLHGKEIHRSGKYKLHKKKDDLDYVSTDVSLEWSSGGHIVLYRGRELLGFYDPKTSGLLYIYGYGKYLDGSYVGTDLLSDGSGVLAAKLPPKRPGTADGPPTRDPNYVPFPDIAVFDWKGTVRHIKSPPTPAPVKKLVDQDDAPCYAYYADWKANVLQFQVQDYRLDIDPRAGTARWWSLPLGLEKQIPRRDPNAEYQIVPVGAGGVYVYLKATETQSSLELIDTKKRSHRVVAGNGTSTVGAIRSPDRNKIALFVQERIPAKKLMRNKIVIIDHTGAEVASIVRSEHPYEDPPPMPVEPDGPVAVPAERAPDVPVAPAASAAPAPFAPAAPAPGEAAPK